MARALYTSQGITSSGITLNLEPYAQITLYEKGTTNPLPDTIYADNNSGVTLPNPFSADQYGNFQFALTDHKRVNIKINTVTYEYQPVLPDPTDMVVGKKDSALINTSYPFLTNMNLGERWEHVRGNPTNPLAPNGGMVATLAKPLINLLDNANSNVFEGGLVSGVYVFGVRSWGDFGIRGMATAATTTSISDSTLSMTTNQFASVLDPWSVYIYAGVCAGQIRKIISNTGTLVNIDPSTPWLDAAGSPTTPDFSSSSSGPLRSYFTINRGSGADKVGVDAWAENNNRAKTWNGLVNNLQPLAAHVTSKGTFVTFGTATGGSASTLVQTGAGWTTNQFVDVNDPYVVYAIAGTCAGQERTISSNTSTTLNVTPNWTGTPDSTTVFQIFHTTIAPRAVGLFIGSGVNVGSRAMAGGTEIDIFNNSYDAVWYDGLAKSTYGLIIGTFNTGNGKRNSAGIALGGGDPTRDSFKTGILFGYASGGVDSIGIDFVDNWDGGLGGIPMRIKSGQFIYAASNLLNYNVDYAGRTTVLGGVHHHFPLIGSGSFNETFVVNASTIYMTNNNTGSILAGVFDTVNGFFGVGGTPSVLGHFKNAADCQVRLTRNGLVSVELGATSALGRVQTQTNHPLRFGTNNTDRMILETNGRWAWNTSTSYREYEYVTASVANGASVNLHDITTNPLGKVTIQDNATFFAEFGLQASTTILTAGDGTRWANSDTAGKSCVFVSGGVKVIKNNTGGAVTYFCKFWST